LRLITADATMAAASQHRRHQAGSGARREGLHPSSRVSTITVETISNTNVVSVIATLAAGICGQANGQNAMVDVGRPPFAHVGEQPIGAACASSGITGAVGAEWAYIF
jgi:hypothetical protein